MPIRSVWMARHDNDWKTYAIPQVDGTFVAVAVPPEGKPTNPFDYIEMDLETAMTAAMFALKKKSGHDTCSAACSGWELHTHNEP